MAAAGSTTGRAFVGAVLYALVLAGGLSSCAPAHLDAAGPPRRDRQDQVDADRLRSASPGALERLEAGEARAVTGDVAGALDVFRAVAREAPENALVARRICEAAAALGRHDEAVGACDHASRIVHDTSPIARISPIELRAMVRAQVSGPESVTPTHLTLVAPLAEGAVAIAPDQPWGYAARCDIAERTGDDRMLQQCVKDLERVAPGHIETERARAAAARLRPGAGVWAAWALLVAVTFGAFAGAIGRGVRRAVSLFTRRAAVAAALTVGMFAARSAHADAPAASATPAADMQEIHAERLSKWPIDDQNPEKSIPAPDVIAKDPLEMGYWVMDLIAKATMASKMGNHEAATRYYAAMAKAVPNRAIPYSKMCKEYLTMGDRQNGYAACAAAVTLPGATLDDYTQYVGLVLASSGKLPDKILASLDILASRLQAMPPGTNGVDELLCAIGVREHNDELLGKCVPNLVARSPSDPLTFIAQWTLAVDRGDMTAAHDVIDRARAAGVSAETVGQLEDRFAQESPRRTRATILGITMVVLLIVALGALVVLIRGARKLPTDADLAPASPPETAENGVGPHDMAGAADATSPGDRATLEPPGDSAV
jgi:hypothetical protein